jgi:uncharacterized protein (DUF1501 family)
MLVGCSHAIAALAGGRLRDVVLGPETDTTQRDIFALVFLRGGVDGLSLVAPYADEDYINNRQALRINAPGSSQNAAHDLPNPLDHNVLFGLHPKGGPLKELYDAQRLAIVHACGLTNGTRSHFDAMDYMERGTPDSLSTATGWLTRHLESINAAGYIPALAAASLPPGSLLNSADAIAMTKANDFKLHGHWKYGPKQKTALRAFYADTSALEQMGKTTLDTVDAVAAKNLGAYTPEPGVEYPSDWYVNSFSDSLKTVAQLIKADLNVQVATVDYGGWDTHEGQKWVLPNLIDGLSRGINAFYNDLHRYHGRLTVVIMSEFGRRLRENRSEGTDHGHGNVMMVLGGNVNGGKIYGDWPSLAPEALDHYVDLAITTDYRRVLSEIVVRRLANTQLDRVFPNYGQYAPLGIVNGLDLPVSDVTLDQRLYVPMTR